MSLSATVDFGTSVITNEDVLLAKMPDQTGIRTAELQHMSSKDVNTLLPR